MYENFDEMKALADQARERLEEQVRFNNDNKVDEDTSNIDNEPVDLYAEFRDDYEEDVYEGYEEDEEAEEVYYGPIPTLENDGEHEPVPTLNNYDEPLFPGGPGKAQIDSWKKEWEGYDIYICEVLSETFIFRTLNRFEYKQLISLQKIDALQREEVICQTVTLWPENYTWKEMATAKAGIPSTYSDIIMEKSGFTKDYAIQVI